MQLIKMRNTLLVAMLILLSACASQPSTQTIYSGNPIVEEQEPVVEEELVFSEAGPYVRARILADILYAAKIAFDNNRLMSPSSDNAYDRYIHVLNLAPENEVAQQGLRDIVLRYIELADSAIAQQELEQAANMLNNAAILNPQSNELRAARARLDFARKNKSDVYNLDPNELSEQSLEMMNTLADIAQELMSQELMFLINARTDVEGRWIYKVMRESVGGYRLRGNIEISSSPNILVINPVSDSPE